MSAKTLLFVNSADRATGSSSNINFRIDLKQSLPRPVSGIKLDYFQCVNRFNNIISGVNDQFDWTDTSSTYNFTIPSGIYTPTELASYLQTTMNATSSDVFTISYSAITGKFTFADATGNFTLLFSNTDNPYSLLGFANANTSSAGSHTSSTISDSLIPFALMLDINITQKNVLSTNLSSVNHSFVIPMNTYTRDALIEFKSNNDFIQYFDNSNYRWVDFQVELSRQDGGAMYLDSGMEIMFCLCLYY